MVRFHSRIPTDKDKIMFDKALTIAMNAMSGKELTDDDKNYVRKRNAKHEIIRYVYMEKMKYEGSQLVNFQFTPGDSFVDTPIIDIVNSLLKINKNIKDGKVTPLDFGDVSLVRRPRLKPPTLN
jgi:hypothetical protein